MSTDTHNATPALDQLVEQTKARFWVKLQAGDFGAAPLTVNPDNLGTGVLAALQGSVIDVWEKYEDGQVLAVLAELWHNHDNYPLGADEPDLNRVLEVSSPHNVLFDLVLHIVLVRLTVLPPSEDAPPAASD